MSNPDHTADLSAAEQAELDAAAAEQQAAEAARQAQEAADREAAEAAAREAERDPVAEATAAAAAAKEAAEAAQAEAAAAQRRIAELEAAQAAQQQQQQAQPRDYAAELSALEDKLDAGTLSHEEFKAQERSLIAEQAREEERARIAAEAQQRAEADANAAWDNAYATFIADPNNAALVNDPVKNPSFQAAINVIFNEKGGQIAYPELLAAARERAFGIPAVDPQAAIRDAEAQRRLAQPGVQQSLRETPSAGHNTGNVPGASLDNLPHDQLEDRLAMMSEADVAAFLADAPGGLRDNPRYTGAGE